MFWNRKKKPVITWRDGNGKIVCPGDRCGQNCDDSCPIWLNTIGLNMIKMHHPENAIEVFRKALEIAPDFYDAQNNLGSAYGHSNQHREAYEAFKKALVMKPDSSKTLTGLIVAERHLGMYEDALKHCDKLDKLGVDVSKLRVNILNEIKKDEIKSNYTDLIGMILEKSYENGYINSPQYVFVPEIMMQAPEVCNKINKGILELETEAGHDFAAALPHVLVWCAFAGMGAVYHWNENWNNLSQKGIYEVLTAKCGLSTMDEHVLDLIGMEWESEETNNFVKFLYMLTAICFEQANTKGASVEAFMAGAESMYAFGMIFEMNRLGMA